MSQQLPNPSNQVSQSQSASESSLYRDNTSRNINGKHLRDDFGEDQLEAPRKFPRLDGDHQGERGDSQQPSNPILNTANQDRKQEFVSGPGHIIFIDERGKSCPAFAFNKGLINAFIQNTLNNRESQEKDRAAQTAQRELEQIKSSNQSARLEEAKRKVQEATQNQEEIEAEIPNLIEAQRRYDTLARENNSSKLRLGYSRQVLVMVIEQILNTKKLLEVPSPKVQEPEEPTKGPPSKPAPTPEKTIDDTQKPSNRVFGPTGTRPQPPHNTEEQLTQPQLALRALRQAAEELDYYDKQLTVVHETWAQDVASNKRHHQERYPNRPWSTTQTDLDLTGLLKARRATGRLIAAEDAYDRAEQRAQALGLGDILADPHALYMGEHHNEFPTLLAPRRSPAAVPVDGSRIEAWMASVPDAGGDGHEREDGDEGEDEVGFGEVDDWEGRSVEAFESVSVVARDFCRKKIDRWREISGQFGRDREVEGPLLRRNPRRRCRGGGASRSSA